MSKTDHFIQYVVWKNFEQNIDMNEINLNLGIFVNVIRYRQFTSIYLHNLLSPKSKARLWFSTLHVCFTEFAECV